MYMQAHTATMYMWRSSLLACLWQDLITTVAQAISLRSFCFYLLSHCWVYRQVLLCHLVKGQSLLGAILGIMVPTAPIISLLRMMGWKSPHRSWEVPAQPPRILRSQDSMWVPGLPCGRQRPPRPSWYACRWWSRCESTGAEPTSADRSWRTAVLCRSSPANRGRPCHSWSW